ncbi:MAG TPA: hypothetical protein VJJ76_02355 [archaeon]|nr:hypothetical protein [archaeon]
MALFDLSYIQSLGIDQLLFGLIFPFLVLFAIFWGLLATMRVFGTKVNTVLALILSLVILPTSAFVWFATYLVQLGSTLALVVFIAIFVFGVIRWGFSRGKDIYIGTGGYDRQIKEKRKKMHEYLNKLESVSPAERVHLEREISKLRAEVETLEDLKRQHEM